MLFGLAVAETLVRAGDRDPEILMTAAKEEFIKWAHAPENNRASGGT
jgi:hypothetical protein